MDKHGNLQPVNSKVPTGFKCDIEKRKPSHKCVI